MRDVAKMTRTKYSARGQVTPSLGLTDHVSYRKRSSRPVGPESLTPVQLRAILAARSNNLQNAK